MLLISDCSDKCGDTKAIIQEKILTNEQLGKQTVEQVHLSWQTPAWSRSQSRHKSRFRSEIWTQIQIQIRKLDSSLDLNQKSRLQSRSRLEIQTQVQIQIGNLDKSLDLIKSRFRSNLDQLLLFKHVLCCSPSSIQYFSRIL